MNCTVLITRCVFRNANDALSNFFINLFIYIALVYENKNNQDLNFCSTAGIHTLFIEIFQNAFLIPCLIIIPKF